MRGKRETSKQANKQANKQITHGVGGLWGAANDLERLISRVRGNNPVVALCEGAGYAPGRGASSNGLAHSERHKRVEAVHRQQVQVNVVQYELVVGPNDWQV